MINTQEFNCNSIDDCKKCSRLITKNKLRDKKYKLLKTKCSLFANLENYENNLFYYTYDESCNKVDEVFNELPERLQNAYNILRLSFDDYLKKVTNQLLNSYSLITKDDDKDLYKHVQNLKKWNTTGEMKFLFTVINKYGLKVTDIFNEEVSVTDDNFKQLSFKDKVLYLNKNPLVSSLINGDVKPVRKVLHEGKEITDLKLKSVIRLSHAYGVSIIDIL